jgi:hypothetical protein
VQHTAKGDGVVKAVKLGLGALAAVWTLSVVVAFVPKLLATGFSPRWMVELGSGCAAVAFCGLITYWLFESALKKDTEPPPQGGEDEIP